MPASAATGRSIEEIASDHDRVWSSRQGGEVAQPGRKKRKRSKPAVDPSSLPKAKPEKLPKFIEPMLSTAVEKAPSSTDWVHEIKYDGYRVQVRIENGAVKLLTRKGLDWTERFTGVADAVAQLPVKSALIDAEVVVQTEAGVASFTALVDALKTGSGTLILYAFDLLHLDGYDLRAAPLKDRKAALAKILAAHGDTSRIRYSDHIEGEGDAVFRAAGRLGLEGIVSKRLSAPYQSGRSNNWVKIKATERGEFVIAGFVTSTVSKRAIGALVLGEHVGGKLVPSGHVGSGFSATDASNLWKLLDPMRTSTAPLKDETADAKGAKWVEPRLVAEIEFRSRTGGGLIRHATFREIVEGADPAKVVRGRGAAAKAAGGSSAAGQAHQPRPAAVARARDHQARPRRFLYRDRRLDPAAHRGPALEPGALSRRGAGAVLFPEAQMGGIGRCRAAGDRFRTRTSRCWRSTTSPACSSWCRRACSRSIRGARRRIGRSCRTA